MYTHYYCNTSSAKIKSIHQNVYTELVYLKWNKEAQLSSRFRELLSDVFHLVRGDVVIRNREIVNDHELRENVVGESETEEKYEDYEGERGRFQ